MSFSVVARYVPQDVAGWGSWFLQHAQEHRLITDTLLGQSPPVATVEYPIERMGDVSAWLDAHMQMSQSVWSGIGGGQSPDLRTVKWDDPSALNQWFLQHDRWHATVRTALGL